ncbi:MAG TPA: NYN domain-containing protein [Balneolales bacterium]|nr:NYN domain-containing protein [Balneolales bacterium]
MKKQWLIDGNNLMHQLPDLSGKNLNSSDENRFQVANKVNHACRIKNTQAKIIYDGPKGSIPINFKKISVVYSNDRKADELIFRHIEKKDANLRWIVVTDDREIISRAKKFGVNVLSIKAFRNFLTSNSGKSTLHGNVNKPLEKRSNFIVSDKEVDNMLLLYKFRESDESDR